MNKNKVSYKGFTFKRINEPRFKHLWLLLSWVGYFIMFFLTERLIPAQNCHPIHCFLDDIVPFCEWFVIPYVGWYLLIAGSLIYFLNYDVESFKHMQKYITVVWVIAVVIYIVYPSRQDLRPTEFLRDNILTRSVQYLYSIDTNTGVCPSLHCAFSLAAVSAWLRKKDSSVLWKVFIVVFAISICLSTVFIKQHSAIDFFAALPVCIIAELIASYKKKAH